MLSPHSSLKSLVSILPSSSPSSVCRTRNPVPATRSWSWSGQNTVSTPPSTTICQGSKYFLCVANIFRSYLDIFYRVYALLPDEAPEVGAGDWAGQLRHDELRGGLEARHPARVDVVRALAVRPRQQRQLHPAGVQRQEVEADVLELVAGQRGRGELGLQRLLVGDLPEVSLQQLPGLGPRLRGVVALQARDVAAQVRGADARLPARDGLR